VQSVAAHSLDFKRRTAALSFWATRCRAMQLGNATIKSDLSLAVIQVGFQAAHPKSMTA
jgi:hypothetical protein